MLSSETGGVFVDRVLAEQDGRRLDVRLLLHVRIRGGQIVEGVDYFHPEHAWDGLLGMTSQGAPPIRSPSACQYLLPRCARLGGVWDVAHG